MARVTGQYSALCAGNTFPARSYGSIRYKLDVLVNEGAEVEQRSTSLATKSVASVRCVGGWMPDELIKLIQAWCCAVEDDDGPEDILSTARQRELNALYSRFYLLCGGSTTRSRSAVAIVSNELGYRGDDFRVSSTPFVCQPARLVCFDESSEEDARCL